jgi:hypothetical protein
MGSRRGSSKVVRSWFCERQVHRMDSKTSCQHIVVISNEEYKW